MKKRLHNKKAGIAILISIILISLAELIFRATLGLEAVLTTSNLGEQLAVIALAVTILVLTAKGKDRACYICYGAWIGYFVLDQLFELPGIITPMIRLLSNNVTDPFAYIPTIIRIVGMVGIIVIGALLVEYMTDATIYNKAFNTTCVITLLSLLGLIVCDIIIITVMGQPMNMLLGTFNNLYRIAMVFMFTFFAYDSAKHQLKKTDLTK